MGSQRSETVFTPRLNGLRGDTPGFCGAVGRVAFVSSTPVSIRAAVPHQPCLGGGNSATTPPLTASPKAPSLHPREDFSFHRTVPSKAVGSKHPQALLRKPCQPVGAGPTRFLGLLWCPSQYKSPLFSQGTQLKPLELYVAQQNLLLLSVIKLKAIKLNPCIFPGK